MRGRNLHQLEEKEIPHTITHDEDYYNEIYARLIDAQTKEEFVESLSFIKEDIQNNRFWDFNPQKLAEIENYRQQKIEEQQIIDRYEEEMSDYSPEESKALTDKWSKKEESAEISKVEKQFSNILKRYEDAKEEQNPTLFDQFLWTVFLK